MLNILEPDVIRFALKPATAVRSRFPVMAICSKWISRRLAPWTCATSPTGVLEGLGKAPTAQIEDNYFAVYELEEEVRLITPTFGCSRRFIQQGSRSRPWARTAILCCTGGYWTNPLRCKNSVTTSFTSRC
jgi:hypothetical protein